MIIPLYVDENKDKDLIEYLNMQTNRSAFIRLVLNEYRLRDGKVSSSKVEIKSGDNKSISSFAGLFKK